MSIIESEIIEKERKNPLLKPVIVLLLLVLGVYFFGPFIGFTLGFGVLTMKALIGFLMLVTIGILLLPFIGMLFLALWFFVSAVIGVSLFPVLLPAIMSVFLILGVVRLFSR
jgi:fatty acid desaturase